MSLPILLSPCFGLDLFFVLGKFNLTAWTLSSELNRGGFTKAPDELREIQIQITAKPSNRQAPKGVPTFSCSSCYFRNKNTITFFLVLHHAWHSQLLTSVSSPKIKSLSHFILTLSYFKTWLWIGSQADTVVWTQLSVLARWYSYGWIKDCPGVYWHKYFKTYKCP